MIKEAIPEVVDRIDLLAEDSNLSIAGDDNQSIYGFTHAHPDGIVTFDLS